MDFTKSLRAVAGASGDEPVDWNAAATAAKSATDPGTLELSAADREGYAGDVRDAREAIGDLSGIDFDVPGTLQIQNRHHWIDANVETFRRAFAPLAERHGPVAGVARTLNTASTAGALAYIARHVLGQYDPLLLADGDAGHELYFVHPNVVRAATRLEVEYPRFRRWIAFHEVAHAAEFGAAPWLGDYLSGRLEEAVREMTHYDVPREAFGELNVAMTAVEGYAELLMDHAFDEEFADLRAKLDARRRGGDPVSRLVRRLLGFQLKRRQYERGRAFFDTVAGARGIDGAAVVWDRPRNLPTEDELSDPGRWLDRVG
ncbi:MAG: zinc-dependent metalloprotease [Halanaeroarchaeum sp.]